MSVIIITGSSGLIGSETTRFFHDQGFDVVGIDNNLRQYFFGQDGSTLWQKDKLERELSNFTHISTDIRDMAGINSVFQRYGKEISGVIHAAAQPSHDWAAREPHTDFAVNAGGTLNLLEAVRQFCPEATFIFTSTNKVYGDRPNQLPLVELESRWEIAPTHPYHAHGVDEQMSIDQCKHSLFGASKVAADILVQEYGRYFDMNTVVFRGGCLTGPAHSGAMLHGFLAYLVKCALNNRQYEILGYGGKQVRDNIHSHDVVRAFWEVIQRPGCARVYNIGGGRQSNCSILEAITIIENLLQRPFDYSLKGENRIGDHIWWISDMREFCRDYPTWSLTRTVEDIIAEIIEHHQ